MQGATSSSGRDLMSIKNKRIDTGSYVEIRKGTWDPKMPEGRRDGLVVEISGKKRDRITVMFSNGTFVDFHKSFIRVLQRIV